MDLTDQQSQILQQFSTGFDMKINAFAGTGKTTMLKLLVENNAKKKFLVLVFNKSVQQELAKKFPANAFVATIHSFAYRNVKEILHLGMIGSEKQLIPYIVKTYHIPYDVAQFCVNILIEYFNSKEKFINAKYVNHLIQDNEQLLIFYKEHSGELQASLILKILNETFQNMIEWKRSMTHWGYLKYFQLHLDDFSSSFNYDVVMLDEGQDTNYVSLDIFENMNGQKVIVGDTHQGIYGWRGAINAMKTLDYSTFYLSNSFRINNYTANLWDHILKNFKAENQTLKAYFSWGGTWNHKQCIIFRSNAWLIRYIQELDEYEQINLTRNIKDIFEMALSLNKVKQYYLTWNKAYLNTLEERIKMIVEQNKTKQEFAYYITEVLDDYELITNWNLIEKIDINTVYQKAYQHFDDTSLSYLSTAHTVKWLEFDTVEISDDFQDIFKTLYKNFILKRKRKIKQVKEVFYDQKKNATISSMRAIVEEVNLMYVAVTRAIKNLTIKSSAIQRILNTSESQFEEELAKESKK